MVLNGTQASNGAVNADHNVIKNNYASNGNGIYQVANNSTPNDYPSYNGTVTRRSVVNGSSPYKGSLRVGHNANNKLMNGVTNGSSRNSISSYSSSFTAPTNGYENGTTRNRQSPTRQHVSYLSKHPNVFAKFFNLFF